MLNFLADMEGVKLKIFSPKSIFLREQSILYEIRITNFQKLGEN